MIMKSLKMMMTMINANDNDDNDDKEEDGLMWGDRQQRSWSILGAATRSLTGQHMSGVHLQHP